MDMKKILAAFDSAGSKPVTGANDMKRFVSIIKENSAPVADNKLKVGQMVKFGIWNKSQEHRVGKIVSISNSGLEVIVDVDGEQIKLNRANKSLIIQPVKDNQDVGEGAAEDLDAIEKHPAADDNRIQKAISDKKKELGISKEGIHNGLTFKDYFALEEAKKKITAKEDPCWKGYKMVGTKKKGGREVPNCVPGKKGD